MTVAFVLVIITRSKENYILAVILAYINQKN